MDKTEKVVLGSVACLIASVILISLVFLLSKMASTDVPEKNIAPVAKVRVVPNLAPSPHPLETEPKTRVPFAFVTNRERMIRFIFARLMNAKYKTSKGSIFGADDFVLQSLGHNNLFSRDKHGNEIQARVSLEDGDRNFIWSKNESAATTDSFALDAALEFEDILTWCDATSSVSEALNELEKDRASSDLSTYEGKSTPKRTKVGSGFATWTVQIYEQAESNSQGGLRSNVTIDWDWSSN